MFLEALFSSIDLSDTGTRPCGDSISSIVDHLNSVRAVPPEAGPISVGTDVSQTEAKTVNDRLNGEYRFVLLKRVCFLTVAFLFKDVFTYGFVGVCEREYVRGSWGWIWECFFFEKREYISIYLA